jgi:phosphatidylserine/phosphatidylglycerophosphate/cardiolipin synthase-like enzyme
MENTTLHTAWAQPLADDIAQARHSVLLSSLSLQPRKPGSSNPVSRLWDALETAVRAGASIIFMLPQPSTSHPATAYNLTAANNLSALGARPVFAPPSNLLHAKTCAIDDRIIWIGSGNWTAAAAAHNREAYLRCESPALAQKLREHWQAVGLLRA